MITGENWLAFAGALSAAAASAHLGCVVGGASWYRFFGAGERMARMVERGRPEPTLIALGIAAVLAIWAAYAWSGAGLLRQLPFTRPALVAITAIYLARALALPVMLRTMSDRGATFLWTSSAIVLMMGLVHAIGISGAWQHLR